MKSGLHREKITVIPLKNGALWPDCYHVWVNYQVMINSSVKQELNTLRWSEKQIKY